MRHIRIDWAMLAFAFVYGCGGGSGLPFDVKESVFRTFTDGQLYGNTELVIADRTGLCDAIRTGRPLTNIDFLVLNLATIEIFRSSPASEGTYVVAIMIPTAQEPWHMAAGVMNQVRAGCSTPPPGVSPISGSVSIEHIAAQPGGRLEGHFDLSFRPPNGRIQGTLSASFCDTGRSFGVSCQ